jgi:hypothetical protein
MLSARVTIDGFGLVAGFIELSKQVATKFYKSVTN